MNSSFSTSDMIGRRNEYGGHNSNSYGTYSYTYGEPPPSPPPPDEPQAPFYNMCYFWESTQKVYFSENIYSFDIVANNTGFAYCKAPVPPSSPSPPLSPPSVPPNVPAFPSPPPPPSPSTPPMVPPSSPPSPLLPPLWPAEGTQRFVLMDECTSSNWEPTADPYIYKDTGCGRCADLSQPGTYYGDITTMEECQEAVEYLAQYNLTHFTDELTNITFIDETALPFRSIDIEKPFGCNLEFQSISNNIIPDTYQIQLVNATYAGSPLETGKRIRSCASRSDLNFNTRCICKGMPYPPPPPPPLPPRLRHLPFHLFRPFSQIILSFTFSIKDGSLEVGSTLVTDQVQVQVQVSGRSRRRRQTTM